MKMPRQPAGNRAATVVWLALAAAVGCGKSPLDSKVEGVVTVAGKPLPCGTVVFYPVAGGPLIYASIDAHGHYAATTGSRRGLPSGEYKVTVFSIGPSPDPRRQVPGPRLAPERYSDADRSGLHFTVKPGPNRFDISLPAE